MEIYAPLTVPYVYYESISREPKIRGIYLISERFTKAMSECEN